MPSAESFTQELIDEVARDRFRPRAWGRLLSRSWLRSMEDLRASPARARSLWRWSAATLAIGASVLVAAGSLQARGWVVAAYWLLWWFGSVSFMATHLGMIEDAAGAPRERLLVPNGLTFARLALAPLVIAWVDSPSHPFGRAAVVAFVIGMSATDVLDGWLARRRAECTRMGRMLDLLADVVWVTCLTVALYRVGAVSAWLAALVVARYPIVLVAVLGLYFAKGPSELKPTIIGRAATFAVSGFLIAMTIARMLPIRPLPSWAMGAAANAVYVLLIANLAYLVYLAATWNGRRLSDASRPPG